LKYKNASLTSTISPFVDTEIEIGNKNLSFTLFLKKIMLLRGHKNLIAASATTERCVANSLCWQFGVVATLESNPNKPSNNSIDSMMLRDKTRQTGSPKHTVGGYLFSNQR